MIKVLLFAGLQEALGQHEIQMDIPKVTVQEFKEILNETYPRLPALENVMVAINEEYVMDIMTTVDNGDIVALIPPVSGG